MAVAEAPPLTDPPADPPLEGEGEGDQPTPPPIIEGSGQLSMVPGGEAALASEMKLRGGSIAVDGAFEKGDYIDLHVRVRVAEVHFADKHDKSTGEVTDTVRRHIARIDRLTLA